MAPPQPTQNVEPITSPKPADSDARDEEELANFGYKQELKRDWGLMHNFGISFSIIVGPTLPLSAPCECESLRWTRVLLRVSRRCLVMGSIQVDRELPLMTTLRRLELMR